MMLFLLLEKTFQSDPPMKTQKDVAADSNTTDLLEVCNQGSPEGLLQEEPVQTSSPSLLCSYNNPSLVEMSTSEAASAVEAAWDAPCTDQGPQGSRGSQATLPILSPVLPSSSLQSSPSRIPHREQACSSATASSPDALKPGLAHARTKEGKALGSKRKLMEEDEQDSSGQQHLPSTSKGGGRGTGKRVEHMSPRRAKTRRKTRLQRRKELEEEEAEEEEEEKVEEKEEQASPARAGPSSRPEQPEQCRAPEPVNTKQLVRSPEAWGGSLCPIPLVSIPRIFIHQAGGDAKLNAGISVDGGGAGNTEGMMKGSCNHLGGKRAHEMQVQPFPFPSTAKPTTEPHPQAFKFLQGW